MKKVGQYEILYLGEHNLSVAGQHFLESFWPQRREIFVSMLFMLGLLTGSKSVPFHFG